jgi:two-component system, NtrC family, sensor kinase
MASMGELTAGIAHEIQNPLNFVNNFSELSNELLEELKEEIENGNNDEVKALAEDVIQNLEKINHHGKRADDIVKGMLQHSRTSNGIKEPTDINALADEYLRLSYHGLRAKDKSLPDGQAGLNADFKTDFDPNLPKINVIPQDIGRVLLNLINNAFYAVNERSKKGEEGYKPIVSVSTTKVGDKLEIKVADNGNEIPENIKEKIFQPFFTTKPTGQGTGLGLSLSYDIVKAHGGELKALESFLASLKIVEVPESEKYAWNLPNGKTPRMERLNKLGYLHLTMGHLYGRTNNPDKQISSYQQSMAIAESVQNSELAALANWNLGNVYIRLNKLDSALHFVQTTMALEEGKYSGGVLNSIGQIYEAKGDYELALDAYRKSLNQSLEQNNLTVIVRSSLSLSSLFLTLNQPDSSLYYSRKALTTSNNIKGSQDMANAYQLISDVYINQEKADSAYIYLQLATLIRDSLNNVQRENLLAYQNLGFDEQLRLKKLEEEKIQMQSKIRTNTLAGSLFTLIVIAFFLYRNNRQKQKAKQNIEKAYNQLKSTQSQLIQSEKMASLGELTAGIAHEIQNPLNFVNNFSELNAELLQELKEELDNGNLEEVKAIADDITENEGKINHHGKRADAIVKGMLQHSRTSTGQKEPTDINALADEYLRLSYHGLRAKDKSFQCGFQNRIRPQSSKSQCHFARHWAGVVEFD